MSRQLQVFKGGTLMESWTAQPLGLDELKDEAAKRTSTEVKRDEDGAPWVPLATWNGFSWHTGIPNFSVQVDYYLEGNRVRITRAGEEQEYWYVLR